MSWSVQKSACIVCAGVLFVLSNPPSSLTWLKSSVYSSLVSGFGPSGRNCDAVSSASGVVPGSRRPTIGGGGLPGLGSQIPGAVGAEETVELRSGRRFGGGERFAAPRAHPP